MGKRGELPEVVDITNLTDTDWTEINKLVRAFKVAGSKGFWDHMLNLGNQDPIRQIRGASVIKRLRFTAFFD